jgi:hypothetical protein
LKEDLPVKAFINIDPGDVAASASSFFAISGTHSFAAMRPFVDCFRQTLFALDSGRDIGFHLRANRVWAILTVPGISAEDFSAPGHSVSFGVE